ncbi:MAG TPA: ATP-binding cassette domain-containing protein [Ignavibacteria bacterium]|nr:ATP-binding cassette domain-containing protein [Ignavibacteria bacterium]
MSTISINSLTFYYKDSSDKVFNDLNLNIDTGWRLGLTGRNGRGKSTFLNLLNKKLVPVHGSIQSEVETFYFPYEHEIKEQSTFSLIKERIAPFTDWEKQMEMQSKKGDKDSINEYGEILEKYQNANGYEIDSLIKKEFSELEMSNDLLKRNFNTLSGGEQTRTLLIPLFLKKNTFPLIDEPTDHLDMKGRIILGEYLSKKNGFILVSHDRNLLDKCTDHILSINKSDVKLNKGNYAQWKYNMDFEEEFEKRKNENLKREVKSLESSARKRRSWADSKETEKTGAYDKGYIGHKSAKQMKRALNLELRIEKKIDEKKSLLNNKEGERSLKIETIKKSTEKILSVSNATLIFDNRIIFKNFSLDIFKGDRVALTGDNGSGKTSLINAIRKQISLGEGIIYNPNYLEISYSDQNPEWDNGSLREHLKNSNIEETKFRNILGVMGAWGELFDRPLEKFSKGELKKAELCKSFIKPFDLLIWDEPLNYLDIASREQLEKVILEHEPTILFTEHDKKFVENVATKVVYLDKI